MNEGENSSMPNNTNFSSPNISSSDNQTPVDTVTPTQQDVTSSDISAMAGTDAGVVAAAAAAMPESDGRQAISSTPSVSAPSTSRTRLGFSNRRFNQAAAQQSAPSFAGAPDYFNQAVSDLPVDNSSQGNKKKLIALVGLVIAVVAVVVIAIVVVPMLIKPYPDGMTADIIKSELPEETIDTIGKFERQIKSISDQELKISPSVNQHADSNDVANLDERMKLYEKAYNSISKYEAMQYRSDTVEYFKNAKDKMAKMIPIYKTAVERYKKIYAVVNGDAEVESLASLPGYDERLKNDLNGNVNLKALNEKYQKMKCSIEERTTVGTDCYNLKQKLIKLENNKTGSVDLRKMIFGENLETVRSGANLVRRDLLSIRYAVDNKKVGDDE